MCKLTGFVSWNSYSSYRASFESSYNTNQAFCTFLIKAPKWLRTKACILNSSMHPVGVIYIFSEFPHETRVQSTLS